jgi:hypothetical protein
MTVTRRLLVRSDVAHVGLVSSAAMRHSKPHVDLVSAVERRGS